MKRISEFDDDSLENFERESQESEDDNIEEIKSTLEDSGVQEFNPK